MHSRDTDGGLQILPACSFSADHVFAVVADVENYRHFVPWCRKSVVKSRSVRTRRALMAHHSGPQRHLSCLLVSAARRD